jgi:hypothetical protein
MIKLVGHAFLLCGVCLDVDNISNTVGNQIGRNFDGSMFYERSGFLSLWYSTNGIYTFETPLKHMTRTRPVTERVRHFEDSV